MLLGIGSRLPTTAWWIRLWRIDLLPYRELPGRGFPRALHCSWMGYPASTVSFTVCPPRGITGGSGDPGECCIMHERVHSGCERGLPQAAPWPSHTMYTEPDVLLSLSGAISGHAGIPPRILQGSLHNLQHSARWLQLRTRTRVNPTTAPRRADQSLGANGLLPSGAPGCW